MKRIITIALLGTIFFSCEKSSNAIQNEGIIGKWQLTEYFMSPGDAGAWYPADNSILHTIEFKADGSFISSDAAYEGAIGYRQSDSTKINFILPTQIPSETECYFQLQDNNQTLILSPVGCIEGCSNKYKAISGNTEKN